MQSTPEIASDRYVLLDRDGVLNTDRADSVRRLTELELLPTAPRAVQLLNGAGYRVIVVTNQSWVADDDAHAATLDAIHKELSRRISEGGGHLEQIYVCSHSDEDRCACRKPLPGLLLQAQRDHNVDLSRTWAVGDSPRDVHAALAAGCMPALVLTGKTTRANALPDVPVFDDLLAFALHLTQRNEC